MTRWPRATARPPTTTTTGSIPTPANNGGYTWTTYPERLEAAGIRWQVYENMLDNFTDNPLAGFQVFRDAWYRKPGHSESPAPARREHA